MKPINNANVVMFPCRRGQQGPRCYSVNEFDHLTVELIMARHAAGELDSRLLRALAELAMEAGNAV